MLVAPSKLKSKLTTDRQTDRQTDMYSRFVEFVGQQGALTKFVLTPVIDVRAADRDCYGNPGQSAFLTPSSRRQDNTQKGDEARI